MDALTGTLAAIRAAQAAPSALDPSTLAAALELARAAQTSTSPRPPPAPPAIDIDSDPAPSLLHPRAVPSAAAATPSALEWLHASLASNLVQPALDILQSPSSDADIAESLLELYGFEGFDSVAEAIKRRAAIIEAASSFSSAPAQPLPQPPPHHHHHAPPHLAAPPRERTPQSQITFQTAEELVAAKKAKKAQQRLHRHQRGGRDDEDSEDLDLEEWERIRNDSLAQGPGPLISGNRVSRLNGWSCEVGKLTPHLTARARCA